MSIWKFLNSIPMKRYKFLFVLFVRYLRTFEAKIMGLQEEVGEWHAERAFLQHSYKRIHFAIIVNVACITRSWYHILQYDNHCHWSHKGKNSTLLVKKNSPVYFTTSNTRHFTDTISSSSFQKPNLLIFETRKSKNELCACA